MDQVGGVHNGRSRSKVHGGGYHPKIIIYADDIHIGYVGVDNGI